MKTLILLFKGKLKDLQMYIQQEVEKEEKA